MSKIRDNYLAEIIVIIVIADTKFGQVDEDGYSHINEWFNYAGFTYIAE